MPRGGEIARVDRGLDITRGYIDGDWWLPPQDSVLTEKGGGDYLLYDDLLRDDRIASALQQRRGAVLGRPVEVIPGGQSAQDKAAADHLREVLGLGEEQEPGIVDWHSVVDQMLFGPFYGFSVAEAIWQRDGRHWVPELRVRNRRRFAWKVRGKGPVARWKLILRTVQHGNGIEVPEKKFWTMICGSDNSDEPYGRGLAHALYWPTWFKRNQIGFWLVALEKFGSPTAVGKHLPNASEDDKSKLLEAVKAVHTDSGVVIPEGQLIELLESSGRGTIDFEAFNRAMDRAITTVILSETMTTDDGSSLAQAKVHSEVKREIVAADARLVSETFRRSIATWMTEWNYAGARAPIVRWPMDDPPDQNKLAERDALIVGKLGFK
ncbi:MAG: DUF935 family protein, partial [Acidimicrobiia bacterium]|nr:DUF935 family protein [Acidimicrobiia bacterium]